MRVEKGEGDDVELFAAVRLEVVARVVDDHGHAPVGVGMLGMDSPPRLQDDRIDLHGGHAGYAHSERRRGVVPGAGADDQRPPFPRRELEWQLVKLRGAVERGAGGGRKAAERCRREVDRVLVRVAVCGDGVGHDGRRGVAHDVEAVVRRVERAVDGDRRGNDGHHEAHPRGDGARVE